ncbi:MAG: ATP-binding response regulator [Thermoguttaceae bacterium]
MSTQFISNAAHEIRTPLSAITGYAAQILSEYIPTLRESLESDLKDAGKNGTTNGGTNNGADDTKESRLNILKSLENAVDLILTNANFITEITDDILDLAKTGNDVIEAEPKHEPVQLLPFVKRTAELCATVLKNPGVKVQVETTTPTPCEIFTVPSRLKQVLVNLLSNAIKYTPKGNVNLEISWKEPGGLTFVVEDTGLGISPEFIPKLFIPFTRDTAAIKNGIKGTGLGLAITSQVLESLRGTIKVESVLGKGSRFTVYIPVSADKNVQLNPSRHVIQINASTAAIPAQYANLRDAEILLVDDAADIRRLFTAILKKFGVVVFEAEDGESALEIIANRMKSGKMFDLMFVDLRLPRLDGAATAKQLRLNGYTAPIVALSAFSDEEEIKKCIEAGCNDYLSKPTTREELLACAENIISNARHQNQV